MSRESILPQETIFAWDAKRGGRDEDVSKSRGHETSPDTDAADSGVGGSLKDTLGELALDSSGTAAAVLGDAAAGVGTSDDVNVRDSAAAAGPCSKKRVPKAAGAAAAARDTKSEGVTVGRGLKHERLSLNSESSRGDKHRKTGPDKQLSPQKDKQVEAESTTSDADTGKTAAVNGKDSSFPKVPPKDKSPETSKRKKHSSTETPVLKKSRTPDRLVKDHGGYAEVKSPDKLPESSGKDQTPEPSLSARGIGRMQALGKENVSKKAAEKVSTLNVVKPPLEKTVSTPAEVSLKTSPKPSPTTKKRDLMHRKPNTLASGSRKSPGKSKAKDDYELTRDSKLSSHKSEIERKVSFRRPRRVDKSMRDSIHLKHKIAPTIQTRTDDNKKPEKKIEDNPTERPKSWMFENNPFRKQDQNTGDRTNKSDSTGTLEKRKRSVGIKPEVEVIDHSGKKIERINDKQGKDKQGKDKDTELESERKDSFDEKTNKPMSDRNTKDKPWKKKNRLSEFPSVSNPNISLFDKQNGTNSNESTLERRPVKRNRIMIEPPLEKLEKVAAAAAAAEAAKMVESGDAKVSVKEPTEKNTVTEISASKASADKITVTKKEKPEIKPKPDFLTKRPPKPGESVQTSVTEKSNKAALGKKEKPEVKPKPEFLLKYSGKPNKSAEKKSQPENQKSEERLPFVEIYPIGSKPDRGITGNVSVGRSDATSSAFGGTFIKTNPFKLVSFSGGTEKAVDGSKGPIPSVNVQLEKTDPPENTSEPSKPPTPTKQKSFSLFRKGSDKHKDRKSPTPDGKAKGLFRRGSDKGKNKSGGTHANKGGLFGSGSAGERGAKGGSPKPTNPTINVKAANSADENSASASPRDESDLKILSLIKKSKVGTSAIGTVVGASGEKPKRANAAKKEAEPEQQYKSRFAAMKAMWHKGN